VVSDVKFLCNHNRHNLPTAIKRQRTANKCVHPKNLSVQWSPTCDSQWILVCCMDGWKWIFMLCTCIFV